MLEGAEKALLLICDHIRIPQALLQFTTVLPLGEIILPVAMDGDFALFVNAECLLQNCQEELWIQAPNEPAVHLLHDNWIV